MKASNRWSPLAVRIGAALALVALLTTAACGDGVGRPILAATSAGGAGGSIGDADAPVTDAVAPVADGDVPPGAYCSTVATAPDDVAASEIALFDSINGLRQGGGNACGGVPVGNMLPLTLSPALRCSARLHAVDMATRQFFTQTSPEGVGPRERMLAAGFPNSTGAEDLANGAPVPPLNWPSMIVGGEPPGCALGDGTLTHVGVGRSGNLWVVDVARP